jgi:hypothetical protein
MFGKPVYLDQYFDHRPSLDVYQDIATDVLQRIYTLVEKAKALFAAR